MELVTVKIEILSYRPHGLNTTHCWTKQPLTLSYKINLTTFYLISSLIPLEFNATVTK